MCRAGEGDLFELGQLVEQIFQRYDRRGPRRGAPGFIPARGAVWPLRRMSSSRSAQQRKKMFEGERRNVFHLRFKRASSAVAGVR
jgi:hypothetical protein